MTKGAWMCRQYDDSLKIWFAPRENEKPFTDSERAQKWRLSLASLLFFTVLLSDHLWFCAEATLTRTRDKEQDTVVLPSMAHQFPSVEGHSLSPTLQSSQKSLRKGKKAIFLGNSTKPLWLLEASYPHSPFGQCFSVDDAESVCRNLSEGARNKPTHFNMSNFYLPFCNSYTLSDLFFGFSNPDTFNCSGDVVEKGDVAGCRQCVQAYQLYDQHAQEKYEEFEVLLQKYLQSDEYSVRSCSEECKAVYKSWLCSQYFEVTQSECSSKIPCKQYCLEVQKRCPFILPDNDDVVYGGLSSFICTGLYENFPTNAEPECCDVRWELLADEQSKGTKKPYDSSFRHRTPTASSASRLCNSRLKLCVLVLILLHTVLTVSAAQNSTAPGFGSIILEDNSTNEE
ncbi:transmembrane protein FAM155A [Xenopus tropicalis]|uniref:Family with sequence similarity 155 member A n=1 Tax=Xenopus tropicalis TaxID=8364 RepID=A0A803K6T7_XENTR|nr:transmembrane protein FAM155A [Xenopus tropicalis]